MRLVTCWFRMSTAFWSSFWMTLLFQMARIISSSSALSTTSSAIRIWTKMDFPPGFSAFCRRFVFCIDPISFPFPFPLTRAVFYPSYALSWPNRP